MDYKERFILFMVEAGVLTFGDFVTKSGRKTAYFVNTGNYRTGRQIKLLGEFYADAIMAHTGGEFDFIYGPAYKGIPLAVTAASALYEKYNLDKPYCFNRKEAKDHGEGGIIVGHQPVDGEKALIIEDVVTAGTSVRESVPIIKNFGDIAIEKMAVSVDRMEKGAYNKTAATEIKEDFGIEVFFIVSIRDILSVLYNRPINGKVLIDDTIRNKIENYLKQYCAE